MLLKNSEVSNLVKEITQTTNILCYLHRAVWRL
nr:MAG TPA: hypothetical protein [Caudoviricetes sp.]